MSARTLVGFLVVAIAAKLAADHVADVDLYWHLRLGLDALDAGALPRTVSYNSTVPGAPYAPNDWLGQILLAGAFRLGGLPAVGLLKVAVVAATWFLAWRVALARAGGNAAAAGIACVPFVFVAAGNFLSRPLVFAHLLLAAAIAGVGRVRAGRLRAAAGLPVLALLWVNTHGSWPLLFVAAAVPLAGGLARRFRQGKDPAALDLPPGGARALAAALLASVAAVFANPTGWHAWTRPLRLMGHPELRWITEWAPLPVASMNFVLLLACSAALAVALAASGRRRDAAELVAVVALFTAAFAAARGLYACALFAVAPFAEHLAARVPAGRLASRRLNAAAAALAAAVLGGAAARSLATSAAALEGQAPVAATDALFAAGLADAPGFHAFEFGSYLVFRQVPTFVDGRLEPFLKAGVFREFVRLWADGDAVALEARGARWILAPPGSAVAADAALRGWIARHRDAIAELWVPAGSR